MDKNKLLCERLGIPWHEEEIAYSKATKESAICSCGEAFNSYQAIKRHCSKLNPDFTTPAGVHLLLKEMMKREDWELFARYTNFIYASLIHCYPDKKSKTDYSIDIDYILDDTGKLADVTIKWLERKRLPKERSNQEEGGWKTVFNGSML